MAKPGLTGYRAPMRIFVLLCLLVACGTESSSTDAGEDTQVAEDDGIGEEDLAVSDEDAGDRVDTGPVDVGPDMSIAANQIVGSVVYEDRPFDLNGFAAATEWKPARHVDVSLFVGPVQVAETTTDDDGQFVLEHERDVGTAGRIVIYARASHLAHAVQTRGRSGRTYELVQDIVTGAGEVLRFEAPAASTGGAFNIVDVVLDALRLLAPYVGEAAPMVSFAWDQGEAWPCSSCYSDNVVSLGGQVEDTDEYDDDIILHEFGHYFVEHYSADNSPGGSHRERQVSPQLAFGEGIAYFFVLMVTGRPLIVDTYADGRRVIDFENYTQNEETREGFVGTSDNTLAGRLREEIVGGIMFDAFDEARDAESFDEVALGNDIMRIFVDYFGTWPHPNQGAAEIDLADFLWALQCEADVPSAQVQALADDRQFPWVAPAACPR